MAPLKNLALSLLAVSAIVIGACSPANAVYVNLHTVSSYPSGAPAGGITNSRHNLGSLSSSLRTDATTEICVFCHTPHNSNTTDATLPLWNRSGQPRAAYTSYGTTSSGTQGGILGSTTLACLSCHDGVTTFDSIVETAGKGTTAISGEDLAWNFFMPGLLGTGSGSYDHLDSSITGTCSSCHETLGDGLNPAIRLNIGTDLTNDHPVSVPYDASIPTAGLRPTNTVIGAIDLTSELAASAATAYDGNLMQNRWAVRGIITANATIADLLRDGKVECSSCHDPHFKNLSWDEAEQSWTGGWDWCNDTEDCTDGNFLRRVGGNTGSSVCRTCHTK